MSVRKIRRLRRWIGGTLFACTMINYIDRQTLSALAPILKKAVFFVHPLDTGRTS